MSWGEVYKINSNMKKPLNEQIRNLAILPMRIITASTSYTPEKTGIYMVICVGEGGDGDGYPGTYYQSSGGSGGGVAIKTLRLESSQLYNVTVSGTASFSTLMTATAGGNAGGSGGTATGGDYNFTGEKGESQDRYTNDIPARAGSVGVALTGLSQYLRAEVSFTDGTIFSLNWGGSLLGYGGGGSGIVHPANGEKYAYDQTGQPAAVIIIPLEMEE